MPPSCTSPLIDEFKETLTDPEEKLGAEIVQKALLGPCRIIANNVKASRVDALSWRR